MELSINYGLVLAAAVVSFVLGGLWYGPLFGKKWIALAGITPEMMAEAKAKGMGKIMARNYILTLVASFIMATVFAHIIGYASGFLQQSGVMFAVQGAFWVWLGFIAPVTLGKVTWEGKPFQLWIIDNAYYLVSLLAMAIILGKWM